MSSRAGSALDEISGSIQIYLLASRYTVEDNDFVPARGESIYDVRSNKTCTTGHLVFYLAENGYGCSFICVHTNISASLRLHPHYHRTIMLTQFMGFPKLCHASYQWISIWEYCCLTQKSLANSVC